MTNSWAVGINLYTCSPSVVLSRAVEEVIVQQSPTKFGWANAIKRSMVDVTHGCHSSSGLLVVIFVRSFYGAYRYMSTLA